LIDFLPILCIIKEHINLAVEGKRGFEMREKIILECTECLSRNYTMTKRKDDTRRVEVMKFCPKCGKRTLHKETR
jgi:large subunit ribosomal protein L33